VVRVEALLAHLEERPLGEHRTLSASRHLGEQLVASVEWEAVGGTRSPA
jgi:hypothetical protein